LAEGSGSSQGGVLCSSCSRRAVLSRRSSGLHLCREHFVQDFERRVAETVEVGGMIEEGERIAVALSGGKDSTALLLSLQGILDGRNVELVAVTVDEGIAGYRDDTITAARQLCSRVGVEQVIVSFREEFGYDLDEMVGGKRAGSMHLLRRLPQKCLKPHCQAPSCRQGGHRPQPGRRGPDCYDELSQGRL